jgi:uracil-DNA glycosylase family 4
MYDVAEVREVTDSPRTDTTFFCIDVEDVHNFVTAGGVVHNCRPPGNRDPKPDEIASCRPFLEQQIDVIQPKVIVTLGNFATKLLLDTTEGITKVRGRTYPYRSGATLVPTFHPSAALQGGGGDVTAKMRADLVRAKQLLLAEEIVR